MLQHGAAARIVPRGCARYTTGGSLPRVPLVRYGLRVSGSLVCVAALAHPKVALPSTDKSKLQSLALTRDRSSQIKFLWPWPDQAPCLLVVSCAEDDGRHVSQFPVHLGPVQASPVHCFLTSSGGGKGMLRHGSAARTVLRGGCTLCTIGSLSRVPLVRDGLRVSGSLVWVAAPAPLRVLWTDKSKAQGLAGTGTLRSLLPFALAFC